MFIVKADNPDVNYSISFQITDSEGNVVPTPPVTVAVLSDNPPSVEIIQDPADQLKGVAHFGGPGLANINVTVTRTSDGLLLGSFGAQFTVTAGDPAAISGGTIAFEGLTETP